MVGIKGTRDRGIKEVAAGGFVPRRRFGLGPMDWGLGGGITAEIAENAEGRSKKRMKDEG